MIYDKVNHSRQDNQDELDPINMTTESTSPTPIAIEQIRLVDSNKPLVKSNPDLNNNTRDGSSTVVIKAPPGKILSESKEAAVDLLLNEDTKKRDSVKQVSEKSQSDDESSSGDSSNSGVSHNGAKKETRFGSKQRLTSKSNKSLSSNQTSPKSTTSQAVSASVGQL